MADLAAKATSKAPGTESFSIFSGLTPFSSNVVSQPLTKEVIIVSFHRVEMIRTLHLLPSAGTKLIPLTFFCSVYQQMKKHTYKK